MPAYTISSPMSLQLRLANNNDNNNNTNINYVNDIDNDNDLVCLGIKCKVNFSCFRKKSIFKV